MLAAQTFDNAKENGLSLQLCKVNLQTIEEIVIIIIGEEGLYDSKDDFWQF